MSTKFPVERAEELLHRPMAETFDPQSLIALVPIRKDHTLVDVGSGPGRLAIPLAKYAYDGKLYAVDVQQGMLDLVSKQASKMRLSNIECVLSTENSIPLEDGVADGAVLSGVLNEASRPKSLLKDVVRLLRDGGWLAVVEWTPADGKPEFGPPESRRLSEEKLLEMSESLGLRRLTQRHLNPHHYVLVLRK